MNAYCKLRQSKHAQKYPKQPNNVVVTLRRDSTLQRTNHAREIVVHARREARFVQQRNALRVRETKGRVQELQKSGEDKISLFDTN